MNFRTFLYGSQGINHLKVLFEDYKRLAAKREKHSNMLLIEKKPSMQDSQNFEDLENSEDDEDNSFLNEDSGLISENNANDS